MGRRIVGRGYPHDDDLSLALGLGIILLSLILTIKCLLSIIFPPKKGAA